jgi:acid phosphatase type 7
MGLLVALWEVLASVLACAGVLHAGEQPLSRIAIRRATVAVADSASVKARPAVLGLKVSRSCLFSFFFSDGAPISSRLAHIFC